ncbi:unnamed protein product [Prunus armeniaca]
MKLNNFAIEDATGGGGSTGIYYPSFFLLPRFEIKNKNNIRFSTNYKSFSKKNLPINCIASSQVSSLVSCSVNGTFSAQTFINGRSRTEAEQLNRSPEESSGERNEQELSQNENSETWKINRNEISSSEGTDVGVFDFGNKYDAGHIDGLEARKGRNYNIEGNKIDSNKGKRVGIGKFGNNYSMSTASFLLGGLIVLAGISKRKTKTEMYGSEIWGHQNSYTLTCLGI